MEHALGGSESKLVEHGEALHGAIELGKALKVNVAAVLAHMYAVALAVAGGIAMGIKIRKHGLASSKNSIQLQFSTEKSGIQ